MADVSKKPKKKKTAKRVHDAGDVMSPAKKTKRDSVHVDHVDDDDDDHKLSDDAIAGWTSQDMDSLIDAVVEQIPDKDNMKYTTTILKVDWDKISVGHFTGDQCRLAFKVIMTKVRRFRTLSEVCVDAKEWTKHPWASFTKPKGRHPDMPKRPLTPFFQFFVEQRSKLPHMATTEMAKFVSKKFAELSDKKKKKYKDGYEAQMVVFRQRMEEFMQAHPEVKSQLPKKKNEVEGPEKPRTPFELYKESKIEQKMKTGMTRKVAAEEIRKSWSKMIDTKRIKWIKKSILDNTRYEKELNEYKRKHPDFEPAAPRQLLTRLEKELKDRYDGKPERPPPSGYNLYSRKVAKNVDGTSKERMIKIAQMWKELSDEDRAKYNFEAKKASTKYVEEFEKYLNSLPEDSKRQALLESNAKSPKRKIKTDAQGQVVGKKSSPKKPTVETFVEANESESDSDDASDDSESE